MYWFGVTFWVGEFDASTAEQFGQIQKIGGKQT